MMATHYLFDAFGRFAGTSEIATERSTTVVPEQLSPDWNFNGVDWVHAPNLLLTPIANAAPAVVTRSTVLTKLECLRRFTDTELAGIYTAAKTVVQIEVWLEKFKAASEIDLADPATIAGVQSLEASGLIGVGRAVEILTP